MPEKLDLDRMLIELADEQKNDAPKVGKISQTEIGKMVRSKKKRKRRK